MQGWIKIHRKIAQHEIWNDVTTFRLFMFLIINAAHQEVTVNGIKVKRGQYLRSYSKLVDDLAYKEGRGLKRVSKNTIYKCVKKLIDNNMVTVQETELGTLFTVVNYEEYQGFEDDEDNEVGTVNRTNSERTVNEVGTNGELKQELKELKNVKKSSSSSSDFAKVLQVYQQYFGQPVPSPIENEKICDWVEALGEELVLESMRIAYKNNKLFWGYCEGILREWQQKGYTSIFDIEQDSKRAPTNEPKDNLAILHEYAKRHGIPM